MRGHHTGFHLYGWKKRDKKSPLPVNPTISKEKSVSTQCHLPTRFLTPGPGAGDLAEEGGTMLVTLAFSAILTRVSANETVCWDPGLWGCFSATIHFWALLRYRSVVSTGLKSTEGFFADAQDKTDDTLLSLVHVQDERDDTLLSLVHAQNKRWHLLFLIFWMRGVHPLWYHTNDSLTAESVPLYSDDSRYYETLLVLRNKQTCKHPPGCIGI